MGNFATCLVFFSPLSHATLLSSAACAVDQSHTSAALACPCKCLSWYPRPLQLGCKECQNYATNLSGLVAHHVAIVDLKRLARRSNQAMQSELC